MGEVELKREDFVSCPFCNGDKLAISDNGHGLVFNVHCENCHATGPWERCAVDAKDAWNTRQALKDTSNAE
jgi:cytochrome c5